MTRGPVVERIRLATTTEEDIGGYRQELQPSLEDAKAIYRASGRERTGSAWCSFVFGRDCELAVAKWR